MKSDIGGGCDDNFVVRLLVGEVIFFFSPCNLSCSQGLNHPGLTEPPRHLSGVSLLRPPIFFIINVADLELEARWIGLPAAIHNTIGLGKKQARLSLARAGQAASRLRSRVYLCLGS